MPSPFPGMNPYLEQEAVWHYFHERFCPAAAEFLTPQIRPHFIAKIDEHVYIDELPDDARRFVGRGDVTLTQPRPRVGSASAATLEAPGGFGCPLWTSNASRFWKSATARHCAL